MGLMVHSLCELPTEACRGYYVYLLDYGWQEPIAARLHDNLRRMAELASRNDAIVISGTVGSHFADEVLSWHQINGQDADGLLPAILITTRHPQDFRYKAHAGLQHSMLLIPLRTTCKSPDEVVPLLERVFTDIKDHKALLDFTVAQELRKGRDGALVDALILQPTVGGIGVDVKVLWDCLRRGLRRSMRGETGASTAGSE